VKVTRPVVVEADHPEACGVPFKAMVTVPATGLVIARDQDCAPEV
jgi:hypothetical protein